MLVAPNTKLQQTFGLEDWWKATLKSQKFPEGGLPGDQGFVLLKQLLQYDPTRRITAAQALEHPYFAKKPSDNCFEGSEVMYPNRKIAQDELSALDLPGTKRSGLPDDTMKPPQKKAKPG